MKCFLAAFCFAPIVIGLPISASEEELPRTPGGRPDLSGTYDIKTLTPYQRDPSYIGAGWKAMPAGLSSPRLGDRSFTLLDDMKEVIPLRRDAGIRRRDVYLVGECQRLEVGPGRGLGRAGERRVREPGVENRVTSSRARRQLGTGESP